jgi:hypothetical protein
MGSSTRDYFYIQLLQSPKLLGGRLMTSHMSRVIVMVLQEVFHEKLGRRAAS